MTTAQPQRPLRRFGLAAALWVFGIATTVLLVSIWGRAVTGDRETLADAAGAVAEADWLAVQVADWLAAEVAATSGIPEDATAAVVQSVWDRPAAKDAIGDLVGQAVAAGLAPPGTTVVIDPASSIRPLTGDIAAGLLAAGVDTSPAEVAAVIDGIEPVVAVAEPGEQAGAVRRVRAVVTRALIAAVAVMALAGMVALAVGRDRMATLRSLATRVALSAAGFAVLFHVGAWALDPSGGAAPLRRSGAIVLGSNTAGVWWLAAGAALVVIVLRFGRTGGRPQRGGVHSASTSPASSTSTAPFVQ